MNASLQLLWSIPEIRKDIVNLYQPELYKNYTDYHYQIIIILAAMFNNFYSKKSEDDNYYGKNDTDNIIEFNNSINEDTYNKKTRSFWNLLKSK
jgi:hypothetical protein